MKFGLLLLLVGLAACGHIRSAQITVQYGYSGKAVAFVVPFSLQNGLSATDYFLIHWPELMHSGTTKTAVKVSLLTEDGNQLSVSNVLADSVLTDTQYYVGFGIAINSLTWYALKITPAVVPTLATGFVQLSTVSDYLSTAKIVYDRNLAYGYYFIQMSATGPSATLSMAVSSPTSPITTASLIYYLYIDVTPSLSSSSGGNFTLSLYYNSAVHIMGSAGLLDFQFVGECQAIPACSGCAAAALSTCDIDNSLESLKFSLANVVGGQTIRIQVEVQNPIYSSVRGIRGFWVDGVNGIIQENAQVVNALSVAAIPLIDLGTDRVYLLWGMSASYSDADTSGINIGIYAAQSTSPLNGPLNSFNIGFKIQNTSPIDASFTVRVQLLAQGVLQGSIVHNLPNSGNTTYCSYIYPELVCTNVGAFTDPSLRYFVSAKAFYDSSTPTSISNFGGITLESVVYDDFGARISGVSLFTPLVAATPMAVSTSSQFLDLAGIHSPSYSVRYTQVVSYKDDLSRSALGLAMMGFTQGNASTVGVVPNLNTSQQLIFLLNVPQSKMSTLSGNNQYQMKLLYNSHVIGFETGAEGMGLDFAGWSTATNNWTIQTTSCYQTNKVVTQKYFDNFTGYQTINTHKILRDTMNNSMYGIFNFQCGQSSSITALQASTLCAGDCVDECQIFKGFTNTDLGNGVISMRRVTFPTGYHSPLYADHNTLDFVITFLNGGTVVSSTLINAYTVQAAKMVNIKAAYVNYYDDTGKSNKGVRIPMMVRIGGAALANESLGADTIAVFFDQNTFATSFQDSGSYSIGCSTSNCLYYSNMGVVTPQDFWLNSPRVQFKSLPTLLTEFNLLVPVTQKLNTAPTSLTVAFLASNYTVNGITGLLRVLSVFRLYGAAITRNILSPITSINGLAPVAPSSLDIDFNATLWLGSGVTNFLYALDTTLITTTPQNNSVASSGTSINVVVNGTYGAGITVTSFYYNTFGTAYLRINGANNSCTHFWYNYWEQEPSKNLERTGKPVHVMHCPIDSTLNLATSQADVVLVNPQYPSNFVSGFPLQNVLAYGLSSPQGMLMAYRLETGAITLTRSCTTFKMTPYYPNSPGKQRSMFTVAFSPLTLSPSPQLYNSFMLNLLIPSTTVPSTAVLSVLTTVCDSLDSRLSCSITSVSSLNFNLQFTLIGTQMITLSQIDFNVYAISGGTFGTTDNYTITMYLPQSNGVVSQAFGPAYTNKSQYSSCSNIFTTSLTSTSSTITLGNLTLQHPSQGAKGLVSFTLAFGYRDAFFSSSQLHLQLGFLQSPNVWMLRGDLACNVYELYTSQPSWLWKSLDYTTFPVLTLIPKAEILIPSNHILKIVCHGGNIPDAAQSAQHVSAIWTDTGATVETSNPNLPYPTGLITPGTYTPVIVTKRFNNPGMLAYYTFSLLLDTALTSDSRLYIQFPYILPAWSNNNQQVECYMRTADNAATNDVTSAEAFCKVYEERRIVVYTGLNATAGSTLYIDVFNVQQPLTTDITANSFVTIDIDLDSNLTNGLYKYGKVQEVQPSTLAIASMRMLGVVATPLQLQTTQNITITFLAAAGTFSTARRLYVVLPAGYTPWNSRGSILTTNSSCSLIDLLVAPAELVVKCQFISRRIIGIDVLAAPLATQFKLVLQGLTSPADISDEYQNSVTFNLYLVADTTETVVSLFTFDHLFSSVSLVTNPYQSALAWFDSVGTSLTIQNEILMVYTGYYRNWFSLRATTYPQPFQESVNFSIVNFYPLGFIVRPVSSTQLGYSQTMYRMTADPILTQPVMYTLQFSKANDTLNMYSLVPPLKIVVSTAQCVLSALESIYTLAIGGTTLPIIINASQCIPLNNISISMTYSALSSELTASHDLSNIVLTSDSMDGLYYLQVVHTPGLLTNGTNISLSFSLTGPQSFYYAAISPVTLTAITIDPTLGVPVAVLPQITSNNVSSSTTFQLQCSMPSTVYWAVGLAPTVISMTGLDIQARIISGTMGLFSNFTEPNDPYYRVYGVTYSSKANALLSQTVNGLRSNTAYQFKYFCMDQLGRMSEGQTINFTSFNSGGYLLKLQLLFNSSLQYGQISDLTCSMAQNLIVPYVRIMTSAMSTCYDRKLIFYPNLTTQLIQAPVAPGIYSYGVYVLPDYTLPYDNTNTNVKLKLADPLFLSKVLTTTNGGTQLPWLISLSTQDIAYVPNLLPTMTLVTVTPTQTGAVITAMLTNMNGFIVVAMMRGLFYPNLTKPSQVNIKQGIFNAFLTLDAVQMQYSSMNVLVSFTINTLQINTDYTLYYYATVDDPQLSALASNVAAINITTSAHDTITIDWASREVLAVCLLALMLACW